MIARMHGTRRKGSNHTVYRSGHGLYVSTGMEAMF